MECVISLVSYKIQPGDTLSELSQLTGESVETIAERNDMAKSDHLKPGETIVINSPIKRCETWNSIIQGHPGSTKTMIWEQTRWCNLAESFKPLQRYTEPLTAQPQDVLKQDVSKIPYDPVITTDGHHSL